jgi:hypothetical protein
MVLAMPLQLKCVRTMLLFATSHGIGLCQVFEFKVRSVPKTELSKHGIGGSYALQGACYLRSCIKV